MYKNSNHLKETKVVQQTNSHAPSSNRPSKNSARL
jgi:hypothetical protein